jgi:hypothetical protein
LAKIGTATDKVTKRTRLIRLRYIITAKKHPNTLEAMRKRRPAHASATSKLPSGISIMKPSEKTGIWRRFNPATVISAVIFCNEGTRKAPLGTRKNRNRQGASNSR